MKREVKITDIDGNVLLSAHFNCLTKIEVIERGKAIHSWPSNFEDTVDKKDVEGKINAADDMAKAFFDNLPSQLSVSLLSILRNISRSKKECRYEFYSRLTPSTMYVIGKYEIEYRTAITEFLSSRAYTQCKTGVKTFIENARTAAFNALIAKMNAVTKRVESSTDSLTAKYEASEYE